MSVKRGNTKFYLICFRFGHSYSKKRGIGPCRDTEQAQHQYEGTHRRQGTLQKDVQQIVCLHTLSDVPKNQELLGVEQGYASIGDAEKIEGHGK